MSHYSINDREIWQEMRAIKKLAERNVKSNNKKSPTPNRSGKSKSNSHKRLKKRTANCAGMPPDHGEQ